ncbi:MAG TPA: type II toxin-antitoxin system VapC family toxin [Phycisphaerae bacterium]|nr:type II toxin-antitoxin system VapC family toxin [Phycisphaerae bacterium]
MTAYLDASALAKRYFEEVGSEEVGEIWRSHTVVVASAIAYAEVLCAMTRKHREGGLSAVDLQTLLQRFASDWRRVQVLDVSDDLNETIEGVVARHALRGLDAIHLASALYASGESPTPVTFVCGDRRLLAAARAEGLAICPEHWPSQEQPGS